MKISLQYRPFFFFFFSFSFFFFFFGFVLFWVFFVVFFFAFFRRAEVSARRAKSAVPVARYSRFSPLA